MNISLCLLAVTLFSIASSEFTRTCGFCRDKVFDELTVQHDYEGLFFRKREKALSTLYCQGNSSAYTVPCATSCLEIQFEPSFIIKKLKNLEKKAYVLRDCGQGLLFVVGLHSKREMRDFNGSETLDLKSETGSRWLFNFCDSESCFSDSVHKNISVFAEQTKANTGTVTSSILIPLAFIAAVIILILVGALGLSLHCTNGDIPDDEPTESVPMHESGTGESLVHNIECNRFSVVHTEVNEIESSEI